MMMAAGDLVTFGIDAGPVSPMNYKRALLRSPPREFTVEVLSPVKYGNSWSYGLKICPIVRWRRTSDTHSLSSSASSYSEYEVWRRWEDCLDFQETLEAEYGKMSRQKVKVLRRGAAGKKNNTDGLYSLRNAAASFDSLPEGPDPREVAMDVHDLIPSLTRKATLFKVSRSTVKERGDEFAAMIRALFNASEDAPVLLQDLRNCTPVRDFFGFWRRDGDMQKKSAKSATYNHSSQSLTSLSTALSSPTSSVFSATPPISRPFSRYSLRSKSRATSDTARGSISPPPSPPVSASHIGVRKFTPTFLQASRSSVSLAHNRIRADQDTGDSSILFTDELLLEDDSGIGVQPTRRRYPLTPISPPLPSSPHWRARSMLPSASEVQLVRSPKAGVPEPIPEEDLPKPLPRARGNLHAIQGHRNGRVFVSSTDPLSLNSNEHVQSNARAGTRQRAHGRPASPQQHTNPYSQDLLAAIPSPISSSPSASTSSQPSPMSMTRLSITSSISSYIQAISKRSSFTRDSRKSFESTASLELELPFVSSPVALYTPLSQVSELDVPDSIRPQRESVASFASCRTDLSADAVIPRHFGTTLTQQSRRSPSVGSGGDNRVSPTLDRLVPSFVKGSMSEDGEDLIDSYFDDRTDTPRMDNVEKKESPRFMSHRTNNSVGSLSSQGSQLSESYAKSDGAFAVKALYRDSVVVFRAERSMPLAVIRQRIRDRFALHESVPLDQDFVLAYLPPRSLVMKSCSIGGRRRSNSAASTADPSQLKTLTSEVDWHYIATTCGAKVTLHVFDAEESA